MLGSPSTFNKPLPPTRYRCERVLKASDACTTLLVRSTSAGSLYVMKRSTTGSHQSKTQIQTEANILKRASSHPNIISFVESFEDECGRAVLITEWCEGGDLASFLHTAHTSDASDKRLFVQKLFRQLATGLAHLHSLGILHRDLKPRNIFLSSTTTTTSVQFKIGDFGVSKEGGLGETALGTPFYLCPEIVKGRSYSFPSDIWSLGCVVYEVCMGEPPFPAKSLRELLIAIAKKDPQTIDAAVYGEVIAELVSKCLRKEPEERPTATDLVILLEENKRRKPLNKDDCMALLMERFGQDTAFGIVECLKSPDSPQNAFTRALRTNFVRPEGPKIISAIVKLRQDLGRLIACEETLEKALLAIRGPCAEEDFVRLLGWSRHQDMLDNDGYMKLKELSELEALLLN